MGASQTVHVLVEIHHLEAIELSRHVLDLLLFVGWGILNTWGVPLDECPWGPFVLTASFDRSVGHLSIVYVLNPVIAHWACFNLCATHIDVSLRRLLLLSNCVSEEEHHRT